jgi:hypothetical protein
VVIQNHTIGRDLLSNRATRGHESFMPLNKIQFRVVPE